MIYANTTEILLKNGKKALLRGATPQDAQGLLDFLVKIAGKSRFVMTTPEEAAAKTLNFECAFINSAPESPKTCGSCARQTEKLWEAATSPSGGTKKTGTGPLSAF